MSKFRKLVSLLSLSALVILAGAGCSNPFSDKEQGQKDLSEMRKNMSEVQGIDYSISGSTKGMAKGGQQEKTQTLYLFGSQGAQNHVRFDISGKTEINGYVDSDSQMEASVRSVKKGEESSPFELEMRVVDGKRYMQAKNIPSGESQAGAMFGSILKGKWIDTTEQLENQETSGEVNLNKEQIAQMKMLIRDTKFFNVEQDLGTEPIQEDVTARHYIVTPNVKNIKNFIKDVNELKGEAKAQGMMMASVDKWKGKKFDIWVGEEDQLIYRVQTGEVPLQSKESGEYTVNLTVNVNEYNSSIDVEKPENVTTVEEIMKNMMDGSNSEQMMQSQDGRTSNNNNSGFNLETNSKIEGSIDENQIDVEQMQKMQQSQ